jgi:protein-ribulosamine 3-kinase
VTPDRRERIEAAIGETIVEQSPVAGGCIADARLVKTGARHTYFLKQARPGQDPAMLRAEASGLHELRRADAVRTPRVVAVDADFLLLEHIPAGRTRAGTYPELGRALARLHRVAGEAFGFHEDNFLGASPQQNRAAGAAATDWPTFYGEHRLGFQLQLAEKNGHATSELRRALTQLIDTLPERLAGTEEPPTLLHGDLWAGNHLTDAEGRGWLIDPAVSYGHREAELAMTTLFGGYPNEFYAAYRDEHPLAPGWPDREPLYQLYHLLNHLNLFGSSYLGGVMAILRSSV